MAALAVASVLPPLGALALALAWQVPAARRPARGSLRDRSGWSSHRLESSTHSGSGYPDGSRGRPAGGRRRMLAIVGPSGSGKTTLLRVAAGLARPDSR